MLKLFKLERFLLFGLEREAQTSVKLVAYYPQFQTESTKVIQAEHAVYTILQTNLHSYYFSTMLYIPITEPSIFILDGNVVFYSGTGYTKIIVEDLFFMVTLQYPKSLHPPNKDWKTSVFQGNIGYLISQNIPDLIFAATYYGVIHNYLVDIFKAVDTQNTEELKRIRAEVGALNPIVVNLVQIDENAKLKWKFY